MKSNARIYLLAGILLAASLACQTIDGVFGGPTFVPTFAGGEDVQTLPTNTFLPSPTSAILPTATTEAAQASPIPQSSQGPLVVFDDFTSSESGWYRIALNDGRADYVNGGYLIAVDTKNQLYWSTAGYFFTDVRVQVDATFQSGGSDNSFGVICRYLNEDNFYALVISSDGYFAIRKRYQGGQLETIIGDSFQFSENIHLGQQSNTIVAECSGSQLRLFVNGQKIAETTDDAITGGDVGLIVGTFSADSAQVLFDNFTATEIE